MALPTFSFPQRSLLCSSSMYSQRGVDLFLQSLNRHIQVKKSPARLYASLSERGEYASQRPPAPLLDTTNYPIYLKKLSTRELKQLADEVRSDVIFYVSKTRGHLGSSLGVAELTVALHYVFNAPRNKILRDVGHQSYRHNILTGRMNKMHTMRQTDGFTKRSESQYDCFGTGRSSTTLSPGLGIAVGRDLKGGKNHVVAVGSALSRLQLNRPLRELREVAKVSIRFGV